MGAYKDSSGNSIEKDYRGYLTHKVLIITAVVIGCIIVAGISLTINGRGIGFFECYEYLIKHILGVEYEFRSEDWINDFILWDTYAPRVAIAVVSGCGLAVCGVFMQSVFANPLADPYTTGVSDGATLGATVAIITGLTFSNVAGSMGIVVNAFLGALVPAALIILISGAIRMSPATVILLGVALSGIFSGIQTIITYNADPDALTDALRWGIGSFKQIGWSDIHLPFATTLIGVVISMVLYRQLNLLTIGEKGAKSLGMDVEQFKIVSMLLVTFMAAAIICFVGIFGFVGLIAPHMARMVLGGDNKYVIPAAMAIGSFFMLLSDLISRVVIFPEELQAGLIMSAIGAPMFLYMILKRNKGYGDVF